MFLFKFPNPNSSLSQKLKLIVDENIYTVKLSYCLENSPVISNLYNSVPNQSEIHIDISNKNQQFKTIARLLNGKRIYFNSYNIDYIVYASQKLEMTSLHDEIVKYQNYITISEHNGLFKFSEIDSALFHLNYQNFDETYMSELFQNLTQEEMPLVSRIIFYNCSNYMVKAPILFDFLEKLSLKNKIYIESFIKCIDDTVEINLQLLFNLYSRNLITNDHLMHFKIGIPMLSEMIGKDMLLNDKLTLDDLDTIFSTQDSNTIENIKKGMNTSEIAIAIQNDDIDLLQQLSSEEDFDFNKKIPQDIYDQSILKELNTSLLQYSAALGSVKCFKFLLVNGAEPDQNLMKFAIFGGSPEILRICEQRNCSFNNSLIYSVSFHRDIIFDWLLDTKYQIESSTDICSYAFYGREHIYQQWFICKQCNLVGQLGLCNVCSKKCHKNHDGMCYSKMTFCFCDCGDSGNCCCMPDGDTDSSDNENEENVENNEDDIDNDFDTNYKNSDDDEEESSNDDDVYNNDSEKEENVNNKYDIKNIFLNCKNIDEIEEDDDEEYEIKKQPENEDTTTTITKKDNLPQTQPKAKKKKIYKENSKKFVSSSELVIKSYKNMNFVCLKKLVKNGVNIIKSIDPPLLIEAVKNNDITFVKLLLKYPEIDLNNLETIHIYENPLLISIEFQYIEIFDILIKMPQVDVNVCDSSGKTPLYKAVSINNVHMVEELLKRPEILVNGPNSQNTTPIVLSCLKGNDQIFELLFNRKDIMLNFSRRDVYGKPTQSIFLAACISGSIKIVRKLIEYRLNNEKQNENEKNEKENKNDGENEKDGENKNEGENKNDGENEKNGEHEKYGENKYSNNNKNDGSAVRHLNAVDNNEDCLLAIKKSASISSMITDTDFHGSNALHLACKSGNTELIDLLLSTQQFDINGPNNLHYTPLRYVCMSHNLPAFKLLIKQEGINLCSYSKYNQTPLHYSCFRSFYELTDYILDRKIYDVNSVDYENKTPLSYACENGDVRTVERLLKELNIDPNIFDRDKNTPLHVASMYSSKEIIELLLNDSRVQKNLKNNKNQTPIFCSIIYGISFDCFKLFVEDKDVDIHVKDIDNASVLYYAAGFRPDAVELIIDKCLNEINDKTVDGMTPLHNACAIGDEDIVKILLKVPGIKADEVNSYGETPYSMALDQNIQILIKNFLSNHNS